MNLNTLIQCKVVVKIVGSPLQYIVIVFSVMLLCFSPTNTQYPIIVHGERLLKGHVTVTSVSRVGAFRTRTNGVPVHLHFRRGGGDHHAEQGTQAQDQGQE